MASLAYKAFKAGMFPFDSLLLSQVYPREPIKLLLNVDYLHQRTSHYSKTCPTLILFQMGLFYKIFLFCLALGLFIRVRNWARWRSLTKWGEAQGCGDAPNLENKLPWGIERLAIMITGFEGGSSLLVPIDICMPSQLKEREKSYEKPDN